VQGATSIRGSRMRPTISTLGALMEVSVDGVVSHVPLWSQT